MIDLIGISAFHFLRPWWLVLLIPIVLLMFYSKPMLAINSRWTEFIADHLRDALQVNGGHYHWFNPVNVGLVLATLCTLLMAGPSWQRQVSPFVQDQAVLVIALDLSDTMGQQDIQPSRLERAKQKIADLLELRGDARTGLIAYAGSAHQVIPLSNDASLIHQFLAAVDSTMMPKSGKFPETILPLADRMLGDAAVPGTLLLIGDGVAGTTKDAFTAFFEKQSYQFIVLGMGLTEPVAKGVDGQKFGGAHLALQENALKSLASSAGGYYQKNTSDKSDVLRINRLIEHHLASVEDDDRPWMDAGYFLLYPIAFMFLYWFRKGWTLNLCVALFFVHAVTISPSSVAGEFEGNSQSTAVTDRTEKQSIRLLERPLVERVKREFIDLWISPDQQGRYYFERGDYTLAAQRFESLAWQGTAHYYAENFSAAAELFRRIDNPGGRFNLANALAQGQHYVAAVRVYSAVLDEAPNHSGALKNRNFVQQIIDDINRMSASQQTEPGEASKQLGDAPQRADGADQNDIAADEFEQLSAEQILADEQIQEMWMRQVQADPARFLRSKFQLQYSLRTRADTDPTTDQQ
jgi:Ca-activated chloride channel family protein